MKNDDKRRTNPAVKTQALTRLAAGCAALTLAAMAPATASAAVTVLNFTGACAGGCGNGTRVAQSYGDSVGLNISYRSVNVVTGQTFEPFLKTWQVGYGDLSGVIWGGADRTGYRSEIVFEVAEGYEMRLVGFDYATYFQGNTTVPFNIATLDGESLYDDRYGVTPGSHNYFAANTGFSSSGFNLSWGPDGYEVGLDNIAFEIRAIEVPTGGIPEPGAWALMILGFGATGAALRRRGVLAVA
jgi:hypothetical protein